MRVLADSGRSQALEVSPPPPRARVWLGTVTPSRPSAIEPELPEAAPDTVEPGVAASAPPATTALQPPIPRRAATLILPRGVRAPAEVELDVRVDADGQVRDVRWAAGAVDTALVGAADRCARSMSFYPALLGGRPVEVWCRQRFEFAR